VVSKMSGTKEVSWKRLDELWNFIDKDEEFSKIIETTVRESLK